MTAERRRFFRIEDTIGLKTEVVPQQDVEKKLKQFREHQHQFSLRNEFNFELEQHRADLKKIKNRMPEVGRYLEVLKKQLDILTEKTLADKQSSIDEEVPVNLSAQGISFYSNEAVHPDDIVEMHLKLLPENETIVIFSKVINCIKEDNEKGTYKIALDFEHIHDADREILAKHVHGKQLRALGASRFE